MRTVIALLRRTDPHSQDHDRLLNDLMRIVVHHVADEETVLLPQAEAMMTKERLSELGAQMTRRRLELVTPEAGKIAKDTVVGFAGSTAAIAIGVAGALFAVNKFRKHSAHV
jgi:hypothetical protein